MKNTIKIFGIIALAVIIGFSFIACDDGENTGENTGGNTGGNDTVITLTGLESDNFSNQTNHIWLRFNVSGNTFKPTVNDVTISGVNGVTITGITTHNNNDTSHHLHIKVPSKTSGTLTVSVRRSGQQVNGSPKTVFVYNNN